MLKNGETYPDMKDTSKFRRLEERAVFLVKFVIKTEELEIFWEKFLRMPEAILDTEKLIWAEKMEVV